MSGLYALGAGAWCLAGLVIAATDGTAGRDLTDFAQYGVLGLVVLAMVFGKLVPGYIYERRVNEVRELKAENTELRETIEGRVIPALIRSTEVLANYVADERHDDPGTGRARRAR